MRRYVLYVLSLVIFIHLPFYSSNAQAPMAGDTLTPARYALQFQIAEQFNFRSFDGSVLSIRDYRDGVPDRRWAVSFDASIQHGKQVEETKHDTTTNENRYTQNQISGRLIGQRLSALYHRGPVTAYWAWGLTVPFGFHYQPTKYWRTEVDTSHTTRTQRNTDWIIGVGGQGNLGVEVHWKPWMYWFVEYGVRAEFRYLYGRSKQILPQYTPRHTSINTESTYRFEVSPVRLTLGLAIQF